MNVRRRGDHTVGLFWKRTVAAQLHALGCLAMAVGAFHLLPLARLVSPEHFWGCLSFVGTGLLLFLVSSLYHFLTDGYEGSNELHDFFENLDHFSIYLFIAGTYTPFLMNAVEKPWRVNLLIGIWSVALLGITYTWAKPRLPPMLRSRKVYTSLFVVMGWVLIVRIGEIVGHISAGSLAYLVGGGLAYSLGAYVYATKRPRLWAGVFGFHELWHLLVLVGATLHYFLILSFYQSHLP